MIFLRLNVAKTIVIWSSPT